MIGARALRIEDPVLLRGAGRYAADTVRAGELHMRVIRSPVAHGRILSVDVSQALLLDGVVAAWSYADIADLPAISFRLTPRDDLLPYRQPVLARKIVRYVGEPVAVVFATSAYLAEDAAELVEVEIESLPARIDADLDPIEWVDAEQATWAAGLGHELPAQDSEATIFREEYGDVDAAFTGADALIEAGTHRLFEFDARIGRHTGVPMECRGLVATYDEADGLLIVDGAAKVPFWNREAIAEMAGLPPHRVMVRETHVGGGFGPRGELYQRTFWSRWQRCACGCRSSGWRTARRTWSLSITPAPNITSSRPWCASVTAGSRHSRSPSYSTRAPTSALTAQPWPR